MAANRIIKFVIVGIITAVCRFSVSADIKVSFAINAPESEPFVDGELCFSDSVQSVVVFELVKKPKLSVSITTPGEYNITFSSIEHKAWSQLCKIARDTTITIKLEPRVIALGGVTVNADGRRRTTVFGEIFRLSKEAKNSGDPFRALSEISLLQVDIANRLVKMADGESPLVLIDGKYVNTGISPIDPKDIESVEISEVVSAKYLQLGVSKIIDIKLRKDRPKYLFADVRTRHDIPIREGFGGVVFETGTKKIAISGNVSVGYKDDDKQTYRSIEQLADNVKNSDGYSISNYLKWDGRLYLKWAPSNSNYFAVVFKFQTNTNDATNIAQGYYNNVPFNSQRYSKEHKNGGYLGVLFYEYTFSDKSRLTSMFRYNRGEYDPSERYTEELNSEPITSLWTEEECRRDQYAFSIDYDGAQKSWGSIAVGNNFEHTTDNNYDLTTQPKTYGKIARATNYTYFTYSGNKNKLYYMVSAGVQYMHQSVNEIQSYSWWKPRISASIGTSLPVGHQLRLSYNWNSSLPSSSQLHTFNKSSNPWLRIEGNPYLKPIESHTVRFNYDKSISKLRLRLYMQGAFRRNMIESVLINQGDMMIQTYRNNGTYQQYNPGVQLTARIKKVNASVSSDYRWERYNGQQYNGSVGINGYVRWDFCKNFFVYSTFSWRNRSYLPISYTKYCNPIDAHIQIAWQVTKNFYVTVGLPYYWGVRKNISITEGDNYYHMVETQYKSASLRPWILFSWTIRKNSKESIRNKVPGV